MNKIILLLIIPVIIFICAEKSYSQNYSIGANIGSLEYSVSMNTGRAKDYLDVIGFAGLSLTYKKFINRDIAMGVSTGWNIMGKEQDNVTTQLSNGAIYGKQGRYLNYVPFLINATYYINKANKVVPYIQANVGGYYILQRVEVGVYAEDNDHTHFGLAPEAGVLIKLNPTVGMILNARYNYAFSSGKTFRGDSDNDYAYFNFNIGLAYYR